MTRRIQLSSYSPPAFDSGTRIIGGWTSLDSSGQGKKALDLPILESPGDATFFAARSFGIAQRVSAMRGIEEKLGAIVESLHVIIELMARDRERQEDKDRQRFTTAQAAKRLNKSPWTVRRWCELGQVRAELIRLGRSGNRLEWRIDAAEVNRVAQDGPGHEGEFANDD